MSDANEEQLDETARLAELGLLTASLMHELRQPVFAIKALAQILRSEGADPRLAALLEHVDHVEDLIAHYGGFGASLAEATFDLRVPVREAVDMMGHRARALHAELRHEPADAPLRVNGRSSAALQVVVNLLHNALDAVEEGDAGRIVVVRSFVDGDNAVIEVEDTGPGLPLEVRQKLGRPFVTTKPPGRGTGLGLYIAQKLVREHGGDLSFPTPERGGTLVRVALPRT
ncbi:MAG: HAMP domain-containing histidine kinase [Deltaproteobacteria bacterium]|nr:MAG: HAMP domain-containing histidine kinase [Deltaproteobacteria bacterium]